MDFKYDWGYISTTPGSSTQDMPSIGSLLKIKQEMEAKAKEYPEVIVILVNLWTKIEKEFAKEIYTQKIFGIPVWVEFTKEDVLARGLKLLEEGKKRVWLISEDKDDKACCWESTDQSSEMFSPRSQLPWSF